MKAPEWLSEFSRGHAAQIEFADGNRTSRAGSARAPADLRAVAEQLAAFRFDDFVTIKFRGIEDESPMPEVFPDIEILCCDDSGNFILCDYQASLRTDRAKIVYLSHDPFAFVIVAENIREFLGHIASETGKSYQPLSRRYQSLVDEAMRRFDPEIIHGRQEFAKTGEGMPLFVSVEITRVDGAGLVLDVPK